MSVELYDPRHDPEPEGWPEFVAREGLAGLWSYEVLRGASTPSRSPVVLALFREEGAVRGALAAVYFGIRASPPRRRREPIVLDVRLPGEGDEVSWHFSGDVPDTDRAGWLREFEREVRRWLGTGLAGILYRHVTPGSLAAVERRGALVRASIGTARMRIDWPSLDGWLATLNRGRRSDLRRRNRLIEADPGLAVELGPRRTDLDPALLARLAGEHQRRLQPRFDRRAPLPEAYFAALTARDDVSFLTYAEASGRILAFSVLLHRPRLLQLGPWAGVPRDQGGRGHLYFDHYLRAVRYAIERGCEGVTAGRGRLDIKLDLGFHEVPMRLVIVPRWSLG